MPTINVKKQGIPRYCLINYKKGCKVMGKAKEIIYLNGRLKGKLLTDEDCKTLESLMRVDKQKGYVRELKNIIWDLSQEDVDLILETKSNDFVTKTKGELSNLQTVGVAYMYYAKNLVLGDSVGIGKTVEVCGLCNLLKAVYEKEGKEFRCLYLTSKNLLTQAQQEFIRFTGEYTEKVFGLARYVNAFCDENLDYVQHNVVGAHSLFTNERFQEFLVQYKRNNGKYPFDLLVVDEAGDVLTNSATKTYKSASQIREMFSRVVLLNATAFEKELDMFYNQIDFVDNTFLPTKTAFAKEYKVMDYTGPYPRFNGKYKNEDKFRELIGYRYFARTRKSSGATMENCTAEVIVTPLSKEQKELLKITSMPNMVYDCPSYFGTGIETNEYTTPKLDALVKKITVDLKDVKSILVYSRYKEAQECIKSILNEYDVESMILNGDSSEEERESVIKCFKNGNLRVLITNVQKGLNFGNCNFCIFYGFETNPNKMVQFEGRMTRSFNIQDKHVFVILSKGKELSNFKKVAANRAKASSVFAGSDFSCVLDLLLDSALQDIK